MTFAEKLKQLMDSQGLTPFKLAKKVGINRSTIIRYLNTTTEKPTIEKLHQLATYFNITIEELTGEGEQSGKTNNQTNQDVIDETRIAKIEKEITLLLDLITEVRADLKVLKEAEKKKRSA